LFLDTKCLYTTCLIEISILELKIGQKQDLFLKRYLGFAFSIVALRVCSAVTASLDERRDNKSLRERKTATFL